MKLLPALVIANTLQWSFGKLVSIYVNVTFYVYDLCIRRAHDVDVFLCL